MAYEKRWEAVAPKTFLSDGDSEGRVEVANALDFHVKQEVLIKATGQNSTRLEVKEISSQTELYLGPKGKIELRSDLSSYTVAASATIEADIQDRPAIPDKEYERACFEEEPVVAKRVIQVDRLGQKYDSANPAPSLTSFLRDGNAQQVSENTGDPSQNRPLPVKLQGLAGDVSISADNLNLDVQQEGVYDAGLNTNPDNVGMIAHERSVSTGDVQQTQRPTAKRGTVDTDVVAQDVSLHDEDGNKYSNTNPVPVHQNGTFTDRSGTATTTSAQIAPAKADRKYFFIQNISTNTIWFNFGTAAVIGQPSIELGPGDTWLMKDGFVSTEAINVIAESSTRDFTAKEG